MSSKNQIFEKGNQVRYLVDMQVYTVEHVTQTAGTPNQRFYTIKLHGRYLWLWNLDSPAITHTFSEDYAKENLELLKQ